MTEFVETTLDSEICKPILTVLFMLHQPSSFTKPKVVQSAELTAAPPAIVPNKLLLISMTFLTVWLAIQFPAVALESVATMMPPLNLNARVVVPCANLIGQFGLAWSSVVARRKADGCQIESGQNQLFSNNAITSRSTRYEDMAYSRNRWQ